LVFNVQTAVGLKVQEARDDGFLIICLFLEISSLIFIIDDKQLFVLFKQLFVYYFLVFFLIF